MKRYIRAIKAKARIGPNQSITWMEPVPELFAGEVEVILLYNKSRVIPPKRPLHNQPVHYERPSESIAEADWNIIE